MKMLLANSLLAVFVMSSCQVKEVIENTQESQPEAKVFTAIIEDSTSGETKTSLDDEGNVLWKMGDQVSIFAASTVNEQYQVSDDSDGKTAATMNKVGGSGFVAGTEIDKNVAFYPYASTASIAKSGTSYIISDVALPAVQNYVAGSFGNGAFPMAAVTGSTSDMNLKFKNVLGGIKLQLNGTATITSISITGNNNEILCSDAKVTISNGSTPSINLTDASAKTVTLDCGAGVALNSETAASFIIALPPMTLSGGFTIVVSDTEGKQMEISTTKSQTIPRSGLLRMPVVNYEGLAPASIVPTPEAIDLGLPSGIKWASFNIGASAPEEYGDYYAWGEIEPYYSSNDPLTWKDGKSSGYVWASYRWCDGTSSSLTKYNTDHYFGPVDNKTVLDLEDDAAYVNLGSIWRMPTDAEWSELIMTCTYTWTTQGGVNGYLFTAGNSNSIFIPAAGGLWNTSFSLVGSGGYYWSSSLASGTGNSQSAGDIIFFSDGIGGEIRNRSIGFPIRAVTELQY